MGSCNCDVVVIGAGISGLTAAYQLMKKDPSLSVTILEAKDRIGGRTKSGEVMTVNGREKFDTGGQWVSSCQSHVMSLLAELGLETYLQNTVGDNVMMLSDGRRLQYPGLIPPLPVHQLIDVHLFINKLESMRTQVPAIDATLCPHAREWDAMTLQQFIDGQNWFAAAGEIITAICRTVFGADPAHMSLLYMLHYLNAAGGLDPIVSTTYGGGQETKVKGGAWQICERLIERIGEENLRLSSPVQSVEQDETNACVRTVGGLEYKCRYVIISTPPKQTASIDFTPALPREKTHMLRRMIPGQISKVLVTYKEAFWREAGLSGSGLTSGLLSIVEDGCSNICSPALVGFIGGGEHQATSLQDSDSRRSAVLSSLCDLFGDAALDYLDYTELDWMDEKYNEGGPVSVGLPGMLTNNVVQLRTPFRRVHFAGTESATMWCGFMNGAVQAGQRAANEVLFEVRPQAVSTVDLDHLDPGTTTRAWQCEFDAQRQRRYISIRNWTIGIGSVCVAVVIIRRVYSEQLHLSLLSGVMVGGGSLLSMATDWAACMRKKSLSILDGYYTHGCYN